MASGSAKGKWASATTKAVGTFTTSDLERIAKWAVREVTGGSDPDLVQEARIAIWKAAKRYDPTKGCKLSTYVCMKAKYAVLSALGKSKPPPKPKAVDPIDYELLSTASAVLSSVVDYLRCCQVRVVHDWLLYGLYPRGKALSIALAKLAYLTNVQDSAESADNDIGGDVDEVRLW